MQAKSPKIGLFLILIKKSDSQGLTLQGKTAQVRYVDREI